MQQLPIAQPLAGLFRLGGDNETWILVYNIFIYRWICFRVFKVNGWKVRYGVKKAMDLSKGMSMSINSPEWLLQFMTAKLRSWGKVHLCMVDLEKWGRWSCVDRQWLVNGDEWVMFAEKKRKKSPYVDLIVTLILTVLSNLLRRLDKDVFWHCAHIITRVQSCK